MQGFILQILAPIADLTQEVLALPRMNNLEVEKNDFVSWSSGYAQGMEVEVDYSEAEGAVGANCYSRLLYKKCIIYAMKLDL